MNRLLTISPSPHVHTSDSVKKIMYKVILALVPALIWSVIMFGLSALLVTLVAVVACVASEFLIQKFILKNTPTITDGSAILTGILLAFNVPSSVPLWMIVVGSIFAIGVAKMSFGGLGNNPFNPALAGRVFMLISFPVAMTSWPKPGGSFTALTDAMTGPTPLGALKEELKKGGSTVQDILTNGISYLSDGQQVTYHFPSYSDQLFGFMGGSLGEISVLALLIGGLYLLFSKIITWHIPVSFIGSVILFSGIFWLIDPTQYVNPIFHVMTGGIILGAFFMATDMVTSPMNPKGQIIFGIGIGVLTIIIRVWGAYPEGVSFAILIMNALVPLLNNYIKPKRFGEVIVQPKKG